ncbi:MAG: hypothetical protein WEB57_10290 [Pseudohongiellaceae bacterium]
MKLLCGPLVAVALLSCDARVVDVAEGQQQSSQAQADTGLDFEYYRDVVEPLFLRPRGGFVSSESACVSCHTDQATTPMPLLTPQVDSNRRMFWSEEQSLENFESVSRLVNTESPQDSRLLRAPLSPVAGGRRHTGGAFWESEDSSEYRLISNWIESASGSNEVAEIPVEVDFEFFRNCVQPIFINPIEGAVPCAQCHGGEFAVPPSPRSSTWTVEQSRAAFDDFRYFLEPGYPEQSRFMFKLLHPDAGGDLMHNGGRRWFSADDPERQALASWIRGEYTGSECPAPLQF